MASLSWVQVNSMAHCCQACIASATSPRLAWPTASYMDIPDLPAPNPVPSQEKLAAKEQERAKLVATLDNVEATVAPAMPDHAGLLSDPLLNPAGGVEEMGLVKKHDDDEDDW